MNHSIGKALFGLVLSVAVVWTFPVQAQPDTPSEPVDSPRAVAFLVGSNRAPAGRRPLQYAMRDAQLMADTLRHSGRFAAEDVHLLLEPTAEQLLSQLHELVNQRAASQRQASLLLFYYSGHSDGEHVFPAGGPLVLRELREAISIAPAKMRIAILDACRGGSWTGSKGLTVGPALQANDLVNLQTEGTALMASSSGIEDAHEASIYGGSFFTHHVAAGLSGAADSDGDGSVTLREVFNYAKNLTIRDSAQLARSVQHPSFEIELRGRQDIVLAQQSSEGQSALQLSQRRPMQVIHVASGTTVVETLPGEKTTRVRLPAGQYVVRQVGADGVVSKRVELGPGQTVQVDQQQLRLSDQRLAAKHVDNPTVPARFHSTLPESSWEWAIGLGTLTGPRDGYGSVQSLGSSADRDPRLERRAAAGFSLTYGLTDRLTVGVPVPVLAYRFGQRDQAEVIVRGGVPELGYSRIEGFLWALDGGAAHRFWLDPALSLVTSATATARFGGLSARSDATFAADSGLIWQVSERVQVAAGAGWLGGINPQDAASGLTQSAVVIGSTQSLGYRRLPLVSVALWPSFSLEAYATWRIDLQRSELQDRYLGGFAWTF